MRPGTGTVEATDTPPGEWVVCPRCEADDATVVVRSGDRLLGLPGTFQVVRCRPCRFLYTNPQPDHDTLARHYPPGYPLYQPSPNGQAEPTVMRARLRAGVLRARRYPATGDGGGPVWRTAGRLASRLLSQRFVWLPPFVPDGTLVEVGSATGAYLAEMRDLGWDVAGVELDPAASSTARQRYGVDVRTGTLEQAALPEGCADVVVMRMVLEHLRDPRRTLEEVRRILKPSGRLLVSVPNADSLEARLFGSAWYAWDLPRHLSHFTPGSLAALLREAGFGWVRVRHLVNANNLAHSLHYRRGGQGSTTPGRRFWFLAAGQAVVRSAGRIAAEARPREQAHEIRRFYEHGAGPDAQSSTMLTQQAVALMLGAARPVDGVTVDLGCGQGANLATLQRGAASVVGVDVSFAALLAAHRRTDGHVPLAVADAGRLPLADGSVGIVVCSEVLEHVPELGLALAEIARVLRPGGSALITTPNYLNPMGLRKRREDARLGGQRWEPWGSHDGGMERLITPRLLLHALPAEMAVVSRCGLDHYTAWFAPWRLGAWLANRPAIRWLLDERAGRLPVLRSVGMHLCLVARKRS